MAWGVLVALLLCAPVSGVSVSSLSPTTVPSSGGTPLTIVGDSFDSATNYTCKFSVRYYGIFGSTPVTVLNSNTALCLTPKFGFDVYVSVLISANNVPDIVVGDIVANQPLSAKSRYEPTSGDSIDIVVQANTAFSKVAEKLAVSVLFEGDVLASETTIPGQKTQLYFKSSLLPMGVTELSAVYDGPWPWVLPSSSPSSSPSSTLLRRSGQRTFRYVYKFNVTRVVYKDYQVVLDRVSRGLRVADAPYLPQGWFMNSRISDFQTTIAYADRMAHHGINFVMPYYFTTAYNQSQWLLMFDAFHATGMRVLFPLSTQIRAHCFPQVTTACEQMVVGMVTAMQQHPALLGWYISDDTVGQPRTALAEVYSLVKALDPHHPVFATIAGSGNTWEYQIPRPTFDVPMYEWYDMTSPDNLGTMPISYPFSWMPRFICGFGGHGLGWQLELQAAMNFAAGATGFVSWMLWTDRVDTWTPTVLPASFRAARLYLQAASAILGGMPPLPLTLPSPDTTPMAALALSDPNSPCVFVVAVNTAAAGGNLSIHIPSLPDATTATDVAMDRRLSFPATPGHLTELVGAQQHRLYRLNCTAPPPPPKSLLTSNPGFEGDTESGIPNSWFFISIALYTPSDPTGRGLPYTHLFVTSTTAAVGRASLQLSMPLPFTADWPYGLVIPGANTAAGADYTLSFYVRVGPSARPAVALPLNLTLVNMYNHPSVSAGTVTMQGVRTWVLSPTAPLSWQRLTSHFTTSAVARGKMVLYMNTVGTFWLDQFEMYNAADTEVAVGAVPEQQ